jgi:AcrR family transcriptional regulator
VPRIAASSVAEHVAQQEQAVFEAAIGLFVERGYHEVSLADVAAAVGLKRNSLYRYFPDKAHIVVRWFRAELPEQVARSEEMLAAGPDSPPAIERLHQWVEAQLAYARRPEHRLLELFGEIASRLDDATRAELASGHRQLMAPLAGVLAELGVPAEEHGAVIDLIGGVVLAAAGREASHGAEPSAVARVHAAVDAVVAPA